MLCGEISFLRLAGVARGGIAEGVDAEDGNLEFISSFLSALCVSAMKFSFLRPRPASPAGLLSTAMTRAVVPSMLVHGSPTWHAYDSLVESFPEKLVPFSRSSGDQSLQRVKPSPNQPNRLAREDS